MYFESAAVLLGISHGRIGTADTVGTTQSQFCEPAGHFIDGAALDKSAADHSRLLPLRLQPIF